MPTVDIRETGETHTIDGVEIEFQMAPGTEAPAEMHFYFPRHRALCMAENATHNLHNLLTLRGALVRDPHGWAGYLTEAIDRFADRTDVVFASHHWPTWGRDRIVEFLSLQRDMYAYLHDQTLRLLNQGFTGIEIAENFQMPPALHKAWHTHGYYGSVSHNVKAVYQRYMGWFDGNPGRLWAHPPEALGPRYVEASGESTASSRSRARPSTRATSVGRQRCWIMRYSPTRTTPRPESSTPTRSNSSPTAQRTPSGATSSSPARPNCATVSSALRSRPSASILGQLTPEQMFDTFAININGPRAWDLDVAVDVTFLDVDTNYRLTLRNGVLVYRKVAADASTANATVKLANKLRLLTFAAGDSRLARAGDHRGRRGAAVDHRGDRPARPELQHRHALGRRGLMRLCRRGDPQMPRSYRGCRHRRALKSVALDVTSHPASAQIEAAVSAFSTPSATLAIPKASADSDDRAHDHGRARSATSHAVPAGRWSPDRPRTIGTRSMAAKAAPTGNGGRAEFGLTRRTGPVMHADTPRATRPVDVAHHPAGEPRRRHAHAACWRSRAANAAVTALANANELAMTAPTAPAMWVTSLATPAEQLPTGKHDEGECRSRRRAALRLCQHGDLQLDGMAQLPRRGMIDARARPIGAT